MGLSRLLLALLLIAAPVSAGQLYTTTTQQLSSLPINDGTWHRILTVMVPHVQRGQIVTVLGQQEVTNWNPYLVYVGAVVTATGLPLLTPTMASDILPGYHMPVTSAGSDRVQDDGPIEVVLWMWGGSVYGSGPLTVEGIGYGKLSVIVR